MPLSCYDTSVFTLGSRKQKQLMVITNISAFSLCKAYILHDNTLLPPP
jgi:hypothetical protein